MYQSMVREGIASGELIEVDWLQIHLASLGTNVFYFLSSSCVEACCCHTIRLRQRCWRNGGAQLWTFLG